MPGLNTTGREALAAAVRALDPDGQYVVDLDLDRGKVKYADAIKTHEVIEYFAGDEEIVRAYTIAWLCTEGGYSPVNLELEKVYRFGRRGSCQLDILVKHPDDTPFALIELKSPDEFHGLQAPEINGQLFGPAPHEHGAEQLILATVDPFGVAGVHFRSIAIAYTAGMTYEAWSTTREHTTDALPVNYGEPVHVHYAKGTSVDLDSDVTQRHLDRIRAQLHNKLWGGSRDDNAIYAYVVKLLLTKIHDEKSTPDGQAYDFQIFYSGSRREDPRKTFDRINRRYLQAHQRYIHKAAAEKLREEDFSPIELAWVVELIQHVSLTAAAKRNGDILGAFFEAITREGFKQSKGLFFTHYNIAVFVLAALEVDDLAAQKITTSGHTNERLPYIIDPSSGSGTFLLAAMRLITASMLRERASLATTDDIDEEFNAKFPDTSPNQWAKDFIHGIEKREDLTISSKVNMVLHHDGHTNILNGDGLAPLSKFTNSPLLRPRSTRAPYYSKPVTESFDVIASNPPFSTTLDPSTMSSLESTFELARATNSENLFLERYYQLLKPGGRLGVVLPESFFATAENFEPRKFLLRHFHVRAVVTLPQAAFQPWTPTRTSLLFAQKKSVSEESEWTAAENGEVTRLRAAQEALRMPVRRLTRPIKSMKEADFVTYRQEVVSAAAVLGIEVLEAEIQEADAVLSVLKQARAVDVEDLAFRHAAATYPLASFVGLTVGEIGYKRTKRGEQRRPNQLFTAIRSIDEDRTQRVPNVADALDDWRFQIQADSPGDALSIMRGAKLWA